MTSRPAQWIDRMIRRAGFFCWKRGAGTKNRTGSSTSRSTKRLAEQLMNATSIRPSTPFAQKHGPASPVDLRSSGGNLGQNGTTRLRDRPIPPAGRYPSERAQRFLLDISAEFVARDYETTLKRLAIRAIPFLADYCFFDVLSADGALERVGWAHADGGKHELCARVDEFVPARSAIDDPIGKVMRTGQPDFVPDVTSDWMSAVAVNPGHFQRMRELELSSMIAVPLLVSGLTVGVLTFCYCASSGRRYTLEDLWVAEDLAHRAALVVENARLYHELEVAARHKDEFLAMLGHELRNPLAPIRNGMQILRLKGGADPGVAEITEMVERQIRQLTRLVDDLLDVSRVGHGKLNLQMKPVDLNAVVALAIESSRPMIDARKHELTISLPGAAVEVEGDQGRLAQVVTNLLNNSAKYTEDGGRIELTVEAAGDQALVRVRDTGIGIDAAMLPRIFELFAQVRSATSRSAEGLGIGLALVRNIIELHGGSVQAASAGLGHGTEIVVRLPLLRKMAVAQPAAHGSVPPARGAPPRRILIVDDNNDSADSMAILLRLAGHEVRTAYDGVTALELARLQRPEVVICDISMPGMSGLELARALREELGLSGSLLVAVSGYSQEEDRHYSQEAGFNAHLAKPVRLDSLKALLANEGLFTARSPGADTTAIPAG